MEKWEQTSQSKSTHHHFNILIRNKSNNFKKRKKSLNLSLEHFYDGDFTDRRHLAVRTTTLHCISSKDFIAHHPPCIVAAVVADAGKMQLLHPLTLKPHHCNLPENFNLRNFFSYSQKISGDIFHCTAFNFDKIVIPLSRAKVLSENTIFVLLGGGKLIGRPFFVDDEYYTPPWFKLSDDMFDDIVVELKDKKVYVVNRLGKLHLICKNEKSRVLRFSATIDSRPLEGVSGRVGWRKRLVVYSGELYLVVREEEKVFRVYRLVRECGVSRYKLKYCWDEIKEFHWRKVLFVSKDCFFFTREVGGKEYEDCIVFLESGFPNYGENGWEYNDDDDIRVYRLIDGRYGRVGESAEFPEIDWSVPSWVLDEGSGSRSSVHPPIPIEGREPDENNEGAQSELKDSNSKDGEEQEVLELDSDSHDQEQDGFDSDVQVLEGGKPQCDSNSYEMENEEMHSNADIDREDMSPSLFASVSAVEEEVTRTLLRMNGGNEATEEDTSRTNITPSPCTSSKTKSCQNDSPTGKFEGFDIRSDLVPILQKIWRKHGNIVENSTMRNTDIITKALESLATVVQILENTSVQSLSDSEADYLSSTMSDLKFMGFKVNYLVTFVEKAVELHKSKTFVDCLNKLTQLSHQVKDRRAILLDEVAKLTDEENKLTEEMAKVSKLIPFTGQVKFDEPLGLGLT